MPSLTTLLTTTTSLLLLAAAPLTSAIAFTSPSLNDTFAPGANVSITWSAVDTDPPLFSIYLWEFSAWPPYYALVARNVDTTLLETTVEIPCGVAVSENYQFTATNGTNVYVLFAQTEYFAVYPTNATEPCLVKPLEGACNSNNSP